MIQKDRLVSAFLDLVRIDSVSKSEGEIARYLASRLEQLDVEVIRDNAGDRTEGETGNIIGRCSGTAANAPILMLNAHLDTVVPGQGIQPKMEGDVIKSSGDTVLGADDKAGIAIILEVLTVLKEEGGTYGDLDIVFTICEEIGLYGSKYLDYGLVRAKYGYALDARGMGAICTEAPSSDVMTFEIYGLEAHAGVEPEKGINAIQIASEAIAQMNLGRIDYETTANIGVIEGGKATNIVPDFVYVKGEARSRDEAKLTAQTEHMRACMVEAVARHHIEVDGHIKEARLKEQIERSYWAMKLSEEDYVVRLAKAAAQALHQPLDTKAMGGGSDANIFNKEGIQMAILCNGSQSVHTLNEYLSIPDMVACAELALQIVRLNATSKLRSA